MVTNQDIFQYMQFGHLVDLPQSVANGEPWPEYFTREELEESLYRTPHQALAAWLGMFSNHMEPYDRFWLTLEAYASAEYSSIPKSTMIALRKIRPDDYLRELDPELDDVDPVTVYRGGIDIPEERLRNCLSWTTNPIIAIYFYGRAKDIYEANIDDPRARPPAFWKGIIYKSKIIATYNDRQEREIIQHGSVKDIEAVHLTENEYNSMMEQYREHQRKGW